MKKVFFQGLLSYKTPQESIWDFWARKTLLELIRNDSIGNISAKQTP